MLERYVTGRLPSPSGPRRLAVVTGARQVGKTTLARHVYGDDLRYLNLDSPGERQRVRSVPAEGWARAVGPAVLDEVQKEPELLEKVKWAYDEGQLDFSVLLGSSRILLLDRVRESLAGRVFLYEMWPLTIGELAPVYGGRLPREPWILRLATRPEPLGELLEPVLSGVVGPEVGAAQAAAHHVLEWGGLAPLLQYRPEERLEWLDAYQATYLERDLRDLAQLRNLDAFTACHHLAALRAGQILSFSELSRDAALPVTTTRRYLRYLELSYQTFRLNAWARGAGTRWIKAPKLIWFDSGVQRVLSGQVAGLSGGQYESVLTAQVLVTLWSLGARFTPSYMRTAGGLEIDLLLERQDRVLALELKGRPTVSRRDATPFTRARRHLGDRLTGGLVVYRGQEVVKLAEDVFAVPDWLLLGLGAA
ncbi:MAG: ATP-binding protein [Acidobacteriota bacterium]